MEASPSICRVLRLHLPNLLRPRRRFHLANLAQRRQPCSVLSLKLSLRKSPRLLSPVLVNLRRQRRQDSPLVRNLQTILQRLLAHLSRSIPQRHLRIQLPLVLELHKSLKVAHMVSRHLQRRQSVPRLLVNQLPGAASHSALLLPPHRMRRPTLSRSLVVSLHLRPLPMLGCRPKTEQAGLCLARQALPLLPHRLHRLAHPQHCRPLEGHYSRWAQRLLRRWEDALSRKCLGGEASGSEFCSTPARPFSLVVLNQSGHNTFTNSFCSLVP